MVIFEKPLNVRHGSFHEFHQWRNGKITEFQSLEKFTASKQLKFQVARMCLASKSGTNGIIEAMELVSTSILSTNFFHDQPSYAAIRARIATGVEVQFEGQFGKWGSSASASHRDAN